MDNIQVWSSSGYSTVPTDRCSLFGDDPDASTYCGSWRVGSFCHDDKDRCWFETEGICSGNACLIDGDCDPIFARKYDYVGRDL